MTRERLFRMAAYLRVVACGCLLAAAAFPVQSQQSITAAALSGQIQDANGAIVSGATLTITNLETNQRQTTTSDAAGGYRFPLLQVGQYQLSLTANGFASLTRQLTLTVGQTVELAFKLEVAGVSAEVVVDRDQPLIETTRTHVAETIQPSEVRHLPLNGRNYLDLALLVPGVSPTNTGSNQRFAETSAVPGQGLSVSGQRNLANSFVVDGLSANDDAADLTGTYFSQEAIREFQVITSGSIAEFGRTSSGVINIITQSGTNEWHGGVYGFFRNQRFDARNPLAPQKDSLTQAQYGGTVSGPLGRQFRAFIFTNFEQTRRQYTNVVTISNAAVPVINNRLAAVNYRGPRIETGIVPGSFDTTNFFARYDHRFNDREQLHVRYSLYDITAENSRTVGGLNAVSRGSGLDAHDETIQIGNFTTINSETVNELRAQFTRSRLSAPINDSIGPAINISGVANFGTATSSPLARNISLFEITDNLRKRFGDHSLKGGFDFLRNGVDIVFPGAIQGVYAFSSMTNFLNGNYTSFQQAFGAPSQYQSNPNYGFFIQDNWRVRPSLTIDAGLRYDRQSLPQPIITDGNNFAPRIGFAYAHGSRTVIRGGIGLYFDRIPLRATSNALQRDGTKYLVVQFSPTQTGAPVFPNVFATQPTTLVTKPNITRIDPLIEDGYSNQAHLQIEHAFMDSTLVSVGYQHLRGRHIILQRNVNVPTAPASAGVPNLGRPDPNWGNISRYESSGDSYYNSMIVSVVRRAGSWSTLRVSYTLAKALDDTGNFFFSSPQNNFDLRDDLGLSDNDQRHRLVISGTVIPPESQSDSRMRQLLDGFQLGYIFTYASSLPFNIVTGNDRNFDTNNNDRPVGLARNSGRGFGFASLDLRLARRFHLSDHLSLEASAEAFNLLNHANLSIPNNTFGTGTTPLPAFGQATGAFDPRQFQFGLRLSF